MSSLFPEASGWHKFLKNVMGKSMVEAAQITDRACTCSQKLPRVERYNFIVQNCHESTYLLGQCERCLTVYWDED